MPPEEFARTRPAQQREFMVLQGKVAKSHIRPNTAPSLEQGQTFALEKRHDCVEMPRYSCDLRTLDNTYQLSGLQKKQAWRTVIYGVWEPRQLWSSENALRKQQFFLHK